jgi:hypothetical protein
MAGDDRDQRRVDRLVAATARIRPTPFAARSASSAQRMRPCGSSATASIINQTGTPDDPAKARAAAKQAPASPHVHRPVIARARLQRELPNRIDDRDRQIRIAKTSTPKPQRSCFVGGDQTSPEPRCRGTRLLSLRQAKPESCGLRGGVSGFVAAGGPGESPARATRLRPIRKRGVTRIGDRRRPHCCRCGKVPACHLTPGKRAATGGVSLSHDRAELTGDASSGAADAVLLNASGEVAVRSAAPRASPAFGPRADGRVDSVTSFG